MHPLIRRIVVYRPFQIGVGALVLYTLLGFLLLPFLVERAVPNYARDTLHRQASVGAVRVNPFLLTLTAENVKLTEADGKPIAAFRRLFVDFETSSLFHWAWTFRDIRIEGLDLHVERAPHGELNITRLIDSLPKDPQPASKQNLAPARLLLWHVALVDGRLSYLDRAGKQPASATLTPINLDIKELSTLPDRHGAITLNATLAGGGKLQGRAELALQPFTARGRLAITGFPAATAWPFLRDHLRLAEFKGVLDLESGFRVLPDKNTTQLTLSDIHLHAAGLDLREPDAKTPLLALETLDAPGARIDFGKHAVTLPQLALSNGRFGLAIARNGAVNWAHLSVADADPPSSSPTPWQVSLDKVQLANIAVQVADRSRAVPLTLAVGQLGATLKLDIATGAATTVTADAAGIDLVKVALQTEGDAEPPLMLGAVSLSAGTLDTGAHRVAIGQLTVRDGQARLESDDEGRIPLFDAFGATNDQTAAATAPWRYRLATLQLQNCKARLTDAAYQPALTMNLDEIAATLNDLTNDNKTALRFEAALHLVEGGRVSATGTVAADRRGARAKVITDKVNLMPLHALIASHTTLSLKSGVASTAIEWEYTANGQSDAVLNASGTASIDGLLLDETRSGDRFLACQTVTANGIHFRSAPGHLVIDDVRVIEPDAKVLIFPDRTINLIKAFDKNGADKRAELQVTAEQPAKQRFPIEVTRVRVERGKVDYTDQSLVLPFSTKISDFHGTVSGISSDIDSRAKVWLEGRVEQYGSARVNGTLSSFAPKHYTDIHTKFTNVDMPKLSPYSATFAGREIATGKLSLDLQYKIEDGKLSGDNLVLLDHFTLGKSVQSKDALDLPLDLAVALLTDSSGRIDIAIPVAGDVTKPDFAFGKLVGKAIAQAITKIITAPFRALGALLGGGDKQKFEAVVFGPGSAQLAPPQVEMLKQLAEALGKRPQLKLTVEGRYDPKKDGAALRAGHVRRAVSAELDIALSADERPAPVVFDEAKSQRALEAIYRKRAGDHAVETFQTQYEAKAGKPVERVNPVLAVFGKPSPDQAFYEALYKELVQTQPLTDSELPDLAAQRAAVIVNALVKEDGVAPERIDSAAPKAVDKAAKTGVETTLVLSVAGKAAQ
jgi:uncharacterized protein involved in outer membrane biogenesis